MSGEFISKVIFNLGIRCFGEDHMYDKQARALRLLEEAIELCQAVEVPKDQAARCVDIVYSRPSGTIGQELGGVLVCAHAFAFGQGYDIDAIMEKEVLRCLSKNPEHFASRNEEKIKQGL